MNADGSGARRITNSPATEGSPTWTPDGRRIVSAPNATGNFQIWITPLDGSSEAQALTQEPVSNFQPAVSPDGKLIAFSTDRDRARGQNYEIYVMSIDGAEPRAVSQSPASETAPSWFPDGQLAYVVQESGRGGGGRGGRDRPAGLPVLPQVTRRREPTGPEGRHHMRAVVLRGHGDLTQLALADVPAAVVRPPPPIPSAVSTPP